MEKAIYIKKLKKKCEVRGCCNTDTYTLSRSREFGNSIIICASCMGKALSLIDDISPETGSNIPKGCGKVPPLFFNHLLGKAKTGELESKAEQERETEQVQGGIIEEKLVSGKVNSESDEEIEKKSCTNTEIPTNAVSEVESSSTKKAKGAKK